MIEETISNAKFEASITNITTEHTNDDASFEIQDGSGKLFFLYVLEVYRHQD